MLSEHVEGVLEHKRQVAAYIKLVVDDLFSRAVTFGNVIPFHLETDDGLTLLDMIEVAYKLKRDDDCKFRLDAQIDSILKNTVGYLDHCDGDTACHWTRDIIQDFFHRAIVHDDSKFSPEELDAFEEATPNLKNLTYGSEEYRAELRKIKPAIKHHYAVNSHHPEHYEAGISQMCLLDVIEMVCDWMAATKRVKDGDIMKSLPLNKDRFAIDDQLFSIIHNTVLELQERADKAQ